MKYLHKTFDILEFVVLQNGQPVTPSEAAKALDINLVTVTRIMGELVKRGYLQHLSRRGGYVPGAMVTAIGTRNNTFERLASAAREPIAELSRKLHRQVNLSVFQQERRVMLCYRLDGHWAEPWNSFFFDNHAKTGTGRVLLASLSDEEAQRLCREVNRECCPLEELAEVRRNGYARFAGLGETIIGCPVAVPGYPLAALGFGVDDQAADEALKLALECAGKIKNSLLRRNIAY